MAAWRTTKVIPAVVCVGAALLCGLVLLFRRQRWRTKESELPSAIVNRVLFFPSHRQSDAITNTESAVASQNYRRRPTSASYSALLEILGSATRTLNVCMFTLSAREVTQVLINAHHRGVIVRVVVDNEQVGSTGSRVEGLRRAGVQVRTDNSTYFMHHKFSIIDESCLLNGSLNWTAQGVFGNQENVVVTTVPDLVRPFLEHFEVLWTKYDPAKLGPSELSANST